MCKTSAFAITLSIAALSALVLPAPAAGPTSSGPIALSRDGRTLVNVNPDSNTVTIFDVTTDDPVELDRVHVPRDPSSVAITPDGTRAYVASAQDGKVTVVELGKGKKRHSADTGAEPQGLALSPNGTRLYVANSSSNSVTVFDPNGKKLELLATIDLSAAGSAPRAIAVSDDGDADDTDETIFVAMFFAQLRPGKTFLDEGQDNQREGRVVAVSAATNTLVGAPNPIPLGPLANVGFNSNGQLAPGTPGAPAVPSTNPQTFTTPTGAFPNQLAALTLHPTQSRAYIVSTGASPNGPLRFNQNTQGLVSVFDSATRLEVTAAQTDPAVRRTAPLNLNQGINLATTPAPRLFHSNPVDLAWRPNGSDAWVVIQNTNLLVRMTVDAAGIPSVGAPLVAGPSQVVRVDLENPGGDFLPGKAPRGVVINGAGTRAYVFNYISRTLSVVDISNATAPAVVGTAETEKIPKHGSKLTQLVGAELFFAGRGPEGRMSSEGWGGCIVCHPNGRSDNVTWMFAAGPRQTIALDGSFERGGDDACQRVFNWSGIVDETQDFELNTRGVFGGRGLIDDDRLFLAIGGAATTTDSAAIEQFHQVTGAVSTINDLADGAALPTLPAGRRDFGIATLGDDRVFVIGGRSGVLFGTFGGTLVADANAVLEFNPRTNVLTPRSAVGFTPRYSLGAAAVRTAQGWRIYAIGGYASTDPLEAPVSTVEEYNPDADTWRTVASLPTAVAQFGTAVGGGVSTAEPLQLIHVVSGNTGSESASSVANPTPVQRFQADPVGPGTWSAFNPVGLTLRRNHGAATVLRGVTNRIFVVGGQDAGGVVIPAVEEYLAQAVTLVSTPHTSLPAPRARFGIAGSQSTNQIYVVGGIDGGGADQTTVFEYAIANNGPVAGPPGTPSGTWVTRGNLAAPRSGLGLSNPPGVTGFLPVANEGRDFEQDAIELFIKNGIRAARAPVAHNDKAAKRGRELFGTVGLVQAGFSCASCHGGPKWTRSIVDYEAPPSPELGLGLGNERVIGAELRQTLTQGPNPGQFPGVLINVGTFTLAGRVNELRANAADISQAIAPLGANGFNIPSLLSVHETAPYFYSGLAQTLSNVLDGSQDGSGGTRHHFVTDSAHRADLVQFLKAIDEKTDTFP